MKSRRRAVAFLMRNRVALGMSFALVLLFTFVRPANAFYYNVGMFWKRAFASFSWPFTTGTDASYSFGSSIEIVGNVAKLKAGDQVDSDNTPTGFAGGTLDNALWDSTNGYVRLGASGGCDGTIAGCASTLDFSAYEQAVGWAPKYANLVGYWKLNGVGSISTGSSLTAVVGPNLTTGNANAGGMAYATGQLKQGVNFDGTDDYATTASTIDLTGTSKITISFWLKWNSYSNDDRNVLESSTNFNSVSGALRISPNDYSGKFAACFHMPGGYNCAEFTRPSAGVFHHYAFVLDQTQSAASEVIPYVDGAAVSYTKSNSMDTSGVFANETLYIMNRAGNSLYGAGVLDDLAIWNTSLSATEIATIYSTQNPLPMTTAELDQSWTPEWSSLVAYWKMNNNWNDSKGPSNGTAANGATFTASTKLGSHAGTFDGANDYVDVSNHASLSPGTEVTFAAWIYPIAIDEEDIIIERWNQSVTDAQYVFSVYPDQTLNHSYFTTAGGSTWGTPSRGAGRSTGTITLNTWSHVVSTRSGTNISFYINGVPAGSSNPVDTNPYMPSTLTVRLGGQGRAGRSRYFNGRIDEVAMWNKALTAAQVATLYSRQSAQYSGTLTSRVMDAFASGMSWTTLSWIPTLPFFKELPDYASGSIQNETTTDYSSLVGSTGATGDNDLMSGILGLWHLNETSTGTAPGSTDFKDESGNGNHGTKGTSITLNAQGKLGGGISGSGSGSAISIPDSSSLDSPQTTGKFTMSAWIFPKTTGYMGIMGRDKLRFYYSTGQLDLETSVQVLAPTAPVLLNTWSHVTVTGNRATSTVKFYFNGKLYHTATVALPATLDATEAFSIGDTTSWFNPFNGLIDEVGYWSRVLHANEILQLYRRGANRLKHQVRICTASDCSDDATGANWKGPDGTNQTYFSELNNNSAALATTGDVKKGLPSMLFSDFTSPVGTSRYFQYRTILESDDTNTNCNYGSGSTWCSPELKSVTVDPTHYDSTSPTIIGQTGVSYFALSNFAETLGASCPSGIGYNLGVGTAYSSATWYWWDAAANAGAGGWATADGTVTKSNSAATIASNAATFRAQVGTSNTVYFKAFLKSSGATSCELDQIDISGQQ